jgi:hypothetical protein
VCACVIYIYIYMHVCLILYSACRQISWRRLLLLLFLLWVHRLLKAFAAREKMWSESLIRELLRQHKRHLCRTIRCCCRNRARQRNATRNWKSRKVSIRLPSGHACCYSFRRETFLGQVRYRRPRDQSQNHFEASGSRALGDLICQAARTEAV